MKIIKFNKTRFLKDLDFISRNRKSNFSNKANIVKKILKNVWSSDQDSRETLVNLSKMVSQAFLIFNYFWISWKSSFEIKFYNEKN